MDAAGVGGVALLLAAGYEEPVPIRIGAAEAAQLYYAAGAEFRRPTTVATWAHTLQARAALLHAVLRCATLRCRTGWWRKRAVPGQATDRRRVALLANSLAVRGALPRVWLAWSGTTGVPRVCWPLLLLQAAGSEVQRVVITRAVGTMLYARIVLRLPGARLRTRAGLYRVPRHCVLLIKRVPSLCRHWAVLHCAGLQMPCPPTAGGEQCSLDSRPSDSLALALQTSAPLFIAKHLAR